MSRPLLALLLAALPCPAAAGAWTLAEDSGMVILTTTREIAPVGAMFGGVADSDSNVSQIFVEYGATDAVTLGLVGYGSFSSLADEVELRVGGHVRVRVWQGVQGDVASVQAGASFPAERWLGSGLGDDRPNSATEVDLRVLYGRGWALSWANAFVSAETGVRFRGEGLDEEIRFDATAGLEPWRGVMGLLGVSASVPLGEKGTANLKIAPSLAYTLWPFVGENDKKPEGPLNPTTLQLGVSYDALNPDDGLGLFLSIWKRF